MLGPVARGGQAIAHILMQAFGQTQATTIARAPDHRSDTDRMPLDLDRDVCVLVHAEVRSQPIAPRASVFGGATANETPAQ